MVTFLDSTSLFKDCLNDRDQNEKVEKILKDKKARSMKNERSILQYSKILKTSP